MEGKGAHISTRVLLSLLSPNPHHPALRSSVASAERDWIPTFFYLLFSCANLENLITDASFSL